MSSTEVTNENLVGQLPLEKACTLFGKRVRVIKDDPMDDRVGIENHLRWHIGDEFVVKNVVAHPHGVFLHDVDGHNLNIRRAELVE